MMEQLRDRVQALKNEGLALYLAAKDPRTPWYAKALVFVVVAYTFSPIDLIPDFIPVLGYLDDLIITPGGMWLAVRMIPAEVLAEARVTAASQSADRSVGKVGAAIIILLWILGIALSFYFIRRSLKDYNQNRRHT